MIDTLISASLWILGAFGMLALIIIGGLYRVSDLLFTSLRNYSRNLSRERSQEAEEYCDEHDEHKGI